MKKQLGYGSSAVIVASKAAGKDGLGADKKQQSKTIPYKHKSPMIGIMVKHGSLWYIKVYYSIVYYGIS